MTSHYKEFSKRWKIEEVDKRAFEKFRSGIINILVKHSSHDWDQGIDSKFCERAYVKYIYRDRYKFNLDLGNTEFTISKAKSLDDLLFYLEILLRLFYEISQSKSKEEVLGEEDEYSEDYDDFDFEERLSPQKASDIYSKLITDIRGILNDLPLRITLSDVNGLIVFYPEGAKLLDEKLVDDVLHWISGYTKAYNNFKSALDKYNKKDKPRNILDDLRTSLELFLKEYLGNEKSLENQGQILLSKMKDLGVSSEIRNMFWTIVDFYSKYQNNYVKHDDEVNQKDIEFIFYLTATFIRFLITSKAS